MRTILKGCQLLYGIYRKTANMLPVLHVHIYRVYFSNPVLDSQPRPKTVSVVALHTRCRDNVTGAIELKWY